MKQPCIAVDVSKESSHIQGFYRLNDQASVPICYCYYNSGPVFNRLSVEKGTTIFI